MNNLLKLVPKRYRSYFRIPGELASVMHGFLFGKNLKRVEASTDCLYVQSKADSPNPLASYFDSHTEGPGIWKWRHYFEIYHRHFSKFIGQEVHVLEIGVYSGGSLEMWRNYFGPKSHIYGVDIQDACKSYECDSVRIFIGDQADRNFWQRFKKEVPNIDIVIDDGGHKTHQRIVTLEELLPHIRPGGVYLCEDVRGFYNRFHAYINGLTHNLNGSDGKPEGKVLAAFANSFQRMVRAVHLYPFVVVIEKLEVPVSEFVSPKHGTEWLPIFKKK